MIILPKIVKTILAYLIIFIIGTAVGIGSFYLYTTKVLIPKEKTKIMNEMLGGGASGWEDFFKKAEQEGYANPFEGTKEEASEGEITEEQYVNPFELIEE